MAPNYKRVDAAGVDFAANKMEAVGGERGWVGGGGRKRECREEYLLLAAVIAR